MFYPEDLSLFVPPSLRYIYYFGGLLSGAIKMNSSPLFLHQVLIPSLPNFQGEGGVCHTVHLFFPEDCSYIHLKLTVTTVNKTIRQLNI